jgi:hypothetical protein
VTKRRVLLGGAVGAAAAAALGAGAELPAFADTTSTPGPAGVDANRRTGLGAGARVDNSAFALSHLVVSWSGDTAPGVRLRTASGWSSWKAVHACHGGRDDKPSNGASALLVTPGALGYELDAGSGLATVELNTTRTSGSGRCATLPIGRTGRRVRYLDRAAWGADESLRYNPDGSLAFGPTQFFPTQTLTVHHTAGANDDPDPAATVRAIYYYDAITQGWGDMGYHLLIDEAGRVYEGRWSGDDDIPVFGPDKDANGHPQVVTAAHIAGWNSGNVGVVLLGDFTSVQPKPAALNALENVLAALSEVCVLDPLGITNYVNPVSGVTKTVDTVSGHRDWAATECPGNTFYPNLPAVREATACRLPKKDKG